ncbi:MAG: hypothetical protein N3E45_06580 [Oscillatoriaceae bacterium SKW80]|nr:hypothetical protein [Oscillatoriaceae bacterium SKYG93]MCX8120482.1 hypothetical protein [Oscillatoriaceae bacterium SKW80]MDW8452720.1 hypothetical protein [Oscillatoriaceae cyanobacterium SKYGB_i_bin93]HIK27210.1 hypothetical protein [Oscillatoriaceae cyanobacterium M7585_C2015_266]
MTEEREKKETSALEGIATILKLWFLFTVGFLLLGYTILLSISLGAIASLAGGLILAWWQKEEPDNTLEELPKPNLSNLKKVQEKNRKRRKNLDLFFGENRSQEKEREKIIK